MNHSTTYPRATGGRRVRRLRERAGLSRATLAAISGVGVDLISAIEKDALCALMSEQEIQHALAPSDDTGPQRLMRRTLVSWAEALHRLADALVDSFENLFSADDLAALSDQLWQKIQCGAEQHAAPDQPSTTLLPDNPWHDWGWFRNVALSEDLIDDTSDDQFEAASLEAVIRELVASLQPREQLVLALRYDLDGPHATLAEVGRRLGITANAARGIEQRALRRLRHPYRSRRVRDWLAE